MDVDAFVVANRPTWDRLEKLGVRLERLQLEWISSAEGARFSEVMKGLEEIRRTVTPREIEHTVKVLAEQRRLKEAREAGEGEPLEAAEV